MNQAAQLKNIEERIARQVASVHGYVTLQEIELRDALRSAVGKQWDDVNAKWMPLDAD